jgi:hypothetical protein
MVAFKFDLFRFFFYRSFLPFDSLGLTHLDFLLSLAARLDPFRFYIEVGRLLI